MPLYSIQSTETGERGGVTGPAPRHAPVEPWSEVVAVTTPPPPTEETTVLDPPPALLPVTRTTVPVSFSR